MELWLWNLLGPTVVSTITLTTETWLLIYKNPCLPSFVPMGVSLDLRSWWQMCVSVWFSSPLCQNLLSDVSSRALVLSG